MTNSKPNSRAEKPKFHSYPLWSPRFWHGMRLGDWLSLLTRNRFRIHPARWAMAFAITLLATSNSIMAALQSLLFGGKIARQEPKQPIFIVGHWRSGTTFLHELMSPDDRFATPNTYQCFVPHHFLVSEWILARMFWFILPKKRPMDNMGAGFKHPQEDEFALVTLGVGTPYLHMAFPNEPHAYMNYLDMENIPEEELETWKRSLMKFIRALTYLHGPDKRLVLKSPPHTGRIKVLRDMFPDATFIHIARHPYSVVPSTIRLWDSLEGIQGLQLAKGENRREYVFECYERMYHGFESHRSEIPDDKIYNVRYEDLVADPVSQIESIYERLELGDFEVVRPKLEAMIAERKDYKVNKHRLDDELREEIDRRWEAYMQTYGYEAEVADAPAG